MSTFSFPTAPVFLHEYYQNKLCTYKQSSTWTAYKGFPKHYQSLLCLECRNLIRIEGQHPVNLSNWYLSTVSLDGTFLELYSTFTRRFALATFYGSIYIIQRLGSLKIGGAVMTLMNESSLFASDVSLHHWWPDNLYIIDNEPTPNAARHVDLDVWKWFHVFRYKVNRPNRVPFSSISLI